MLFGSAIARYSAAKIFCSLGTLSVLLLFCSAYAQAGSVSLAWAANIESILGGYQLSYGQSSGNYTTNVDVGNKTSYTLGSLQEGKTYYFAVKAYAIGNLISSGFSNEVSKIIPTSSSAPTASFSANPTSGVAPLTATFTDSSTGSITAWSWNFGDGTTGTGKTAVKTYTNPGTYTASLTVTGSGGSNTKTQTISATAAAPIANFSATPTTGTAPLTVTFTNSSTGSVTTNSWNFGDASTSTSTTPVHTYSTAGTYTVSLTATGSGGTNTKTQTAYITVSSSTVGGGSNNGLVAAYNFEEASGTQVIDASGNANHGTISGATRITQGKFGMALSFDGINDWVTINDAASLDLTTGMTLEAWVYPTVLTSGWRTIMHKEVNQYYLMAGSNLDTPAGAANSTTGRNIVYAPSPLSENTWVHLAVTYDSANVRLYINGAQVRSHAQTGPLTTSTGALRIGGSQAFGEFFQGRIDEIRVYNRTLSATEISTNRNISVASSSAPISFIGTNTLGPISDSLPARQAYAFQNIAAKTGKVTSLSVYVDAGSAATDLVVGLYSNQSGHPYQLLGQGTLTNPTTGQWNNVVLPAISVTSGTQYWIAILSANTGTLWFRDAAAVTAEPSEASNQTTLTTLPSTWSTGTVYNEGPLSAYGAGYP